MRTTFLYTGKITPLARNIKKQKVFLKSYLFIILGSFILAFGIYNIHTYAHIGETGLLGIVLFSYQYMGINPGFSALFLNLCFCFLGYNLMGKQEVIYSLVAGFSFFIFYMVLGLFPRIIPELYQYPLISSILGGIITGTGVGLCLRFGHAPFGDDGLASALRYTLKIPIKFTGFAVDITALILAYGYVSATGFPYTLLSAFISAILTSLISKRLYI